jgi:hypothetical protein
MDWRTDWLALHDRIEGIEQSANLYLRSLGVSTEDPHKVRSKIFRPAFHSVAQAIASFRSAHGTTLPQTAVEAIDRFMQQHGPLLQNAHLDNFGHTVACFTALSGFRSELRFQLTDRSASLLRLTERAFLHLQRTIVADREAREKWKGAFSRGEPACEQLGATHLLLHGIWAFKTSAACERTDLVYDEPTSGLDVGNVAEGLVLTEWKLVRTAREVPSQLAAAETQALLYSQGILGGLELTDSRFIVLVSQDRVSLPADNQVKGFTFRRRNIAVDPLTPSVAGRSKA